MTHVHTGPITEQEVRIARYRLLEREVTDPLAACLLHDIILELEADLQKDREVTMRALSAPTYGMVDRPAPSLLCEWSPYYSGYHHAPLGCYR